MYLGCIIYFQDIKYVILGSLYNRKVSFVGSGENTLLCSRKEVISELKEANIISFLTVYLIAGTEATANVNLGILISSQSTHG
jgi:hypothetical protein